MDLRAGRIVIFLALSVALVWPASGKTSGNDSSKKKSSSKVTLSPGIRTNPFLQTLTTNPSVESNPFLHISDNNNIQSGNPFLHKPDTTHNNNRPGNPFLSVPTDRIQPDLNAGQQTHTLPTSVTFINSNNPFLMIFANSRVDAETSKAPVTQAPYAPPTRAPGPTTSTPRTSTPRTSSPTTDISHPVTVSVKVDPPTSSSPLLSPVQIGIQKRTRSELKCDDYVREIVGVTEIMSLVGTSSDVIKVDNVCQNTNRLVVGGTEARNGEFPHMVALGKRNADETFVLMCGGTLISHTWVLSAAHCTYGPNGSPSVARVGFHRLTDRQFGVTVGIKNMTRHPNYNPPAMYADIALVELASAVTFSDWIRPACLYQQYDTVPISAWISGWGVTEYAGDQTDRLQKAQLNLIDNLACTIQYNSTREVPYGVTPSMICAGDPHGGWSKDSCQGDSGGPLQVIHPRSQCLFQVIGITSFGQGCAIVNIPGVYTRVSHYISWIENIVWPQAQ